MEHTTKELREARCLGAEHAEDDLTVEEAVEANPYSDPLRSRKYWQGYLAMVKEKRRFG